MKNIVTIIAILMLFGKGLTAQTPVYLVQDDFAEELYVNYQEAIELNATEDTLLIPGADRVYRRALADIDSITFEKPEGMLLSYHLLTQAEVNAFNPDNKTIGNLTLGGPGSDIDYVTNIQASGGLERVKGVLAIDNIKDQVLFNNGALLGTLIKCDSSIIIKNCPNLNNANSFDFSSQPVINGDLVLENLPALPFNWTGTGGIRAITEIKGDFIVKDCDFNAFSLASLTTIGGDLHIEGAKGSFWDFHEAYVLDQVGGSIHLINNQVFNSFLGLEHFATVSGDLIIKDCPRFGNFSSTTLTTIEGNFHIENCGNSEAEQFYDFTSLSGLTHIGGNLVVTGNEYLNSLGGLETLTAIGGDVTITMNGSETDQIPVTGLNNGLPGFCLVKDDLDEGVISAEATITLSDYEGTAIDVATLTSCTPPPAFPSFTVSTQADVDAFEATDTIMDLTILNFEAYPYLDALGSKIDVIVGVVTIEGSTDNQATNFFSNVQVDSSIIVKNTTNMNINNFMFLTEIGGDLILENNPGMGFFWGPDAGFQNVDTIRGSLIVKNSRDFGYAGNAFSGLKYIGGDFVVDSCGFGADGFTTLYDLKFMTELRTVEGDILWNENPNLNNLGGFQFITEIGGDVTIIDHPTSGGAIQDGVDGFGNPGWCAVKDALDSGVIDAGATIYLQRQDGSEVDVTSIANCTY
ncbi:MAG: hypothetical protein K9G38_02515 [Bacteroidales bacterium]|nr:hypothetical protein [Bacteroidales bacterium]